MEYQQKLEDAIIAAHDAGDVEGAQILANELKSWKPSRSLESKQKSNMLSRYNSGTNETNESLKNVGGGLYRSAVGIGGGIAYPLEAMGMLGGKDARTLRKSNIDTQFAQDYDVDSSEFKNSKLAGDIALTYPVGGMLGMGAKALGATRLGNSLASGGFALGNNSGNISTNLLLRSAGGAGTGAATGALVDPENIGAYAALGGAIPVGGKLAFEGGKALISPLKYFTNAGQDVMVGKELAGITGDNSSNLANLLKNVKGATPEFNPTVGQSANNAELAAYERMMKQRNPGLFQDAIQAQRTALAKAANTLDGGVPVSELEAARSAAVKPLYEASQDADVMADDVFNELMQRPSVKEAYSAAQKNVRNRGEPMIHGKFTSEPIYDEGAPRFINEFTKSDIRAGKKISGGEKPTLLAQVRKLGGIHIDEISDIAGEKSTRKGKLPVGLFRKKAYYSDDLASQLDDLGYIPTDEMALDGGAGYVRESLTQAIKGNKTYALDDLPFTAPNERYIKSTDYKLPKKKNTELSPQNIYKGKTLQEMKFALDTFKKFNPMASSAENATRSGAGDASNAFNEYLRKNVPSMREADEVYSRMSKPIDQANLGAAIRDKFIPERYRVDNPFFKANEPLQLNGNQLTKLLMNEKTGNSLAKSITGYSRSTLQNTASPKQLATIKDIVSDLRFMDAGETLGRNSTNSTTFQNSIFNAKAENSVLAKTINSNKYGRVLSSVNDFLKKPIEERMAMVLQNPKLAASLLDNSLSKAAKQQALAKALASPSYVQLPVIAGANQ